MRTKPSGPAFEKKRNRTSPKATVGMPSEALKNPFKRNLPRNFFKPKTVAIGSPHKKARIVADPEIRIDLILISTTAGSPENISSIAFKKPSMISFPKTRYTV